MQSLGRLNAVSILRIALAGRGVQGDPLGGFHAIGVEEEVTAKGGSTSRTRSDPVRRGGSQPTVNSMPTGSRRRSFEIVRI